MKEIYKLGFRFIRYIEQHRLKTFFAILVPSFLLFYFNFDNASFFKSLYDAIALFALDVRVETKEIDMLWENSVYVLAILAGGYTVLSVIGLFLKDSMKQNLINSIIENGDHVIVIGLGESNRVYIDSEIKDSKKNNSKLKMIIVEQNKNNPFLEYYQENVGVIIADATNKITLELLNLENSEHVVISTGSDMSNLETVVQLLSISPDVKLFIHLEDRNLRYFHKENGVLSGSNIKVYSYHEEAARELFSTYDIDGTNREVITSSKPYALAVVGDTALAYEVIAQACIMGQLPNGNILTIYCMSTNANRFKDNVELHFPEIQKVPNVVFEYVELDTGLKSFYKDDVWKNEMTNIIICFEVDQKNLDIASNLSNLTFLSDIVDKKMKTNLIISMFNGYELSEAIRDNHDIFQYLHAFGRIHDINDKKYIIGGKRDKQAIATDYIYNNIGPELKDYDSYEYSYYPYLMYQEYVTKEDKLKKESDKRIIEEYQNTGFIKTNEESWDNLLSYFKKESNRAVADQIKMKLKYMGLKARESDKDTRVLFESNKKMFDTHIKDYRVQLAMMEKNRWNAFHYLNGFTSIVFVSKDEKKKMKDVHEAKKIHMCLVEFDDFKKSSGLLLKLGYNKGEFEGYDFMINEHIPLILANAGYAIDTI